MFDNPVVPSPPKDHELISDASLTQLTKLYLEKSLATSTRRFYKIDFKVFTNFCVAMGLSYLPAHPDTIARFLAYQASIGKKPATLERRIAAIKLVHETHGYHNPAQHKAVRAIMRGIKRDKGTAPVKKAPATADRIEKMIAHCQENMGGIRNKALLLLGFGGAFRRSELVNIRMDDIEQTPEGIKVRIRKSKTDQEGKGHIVAILNGTRFRIVDALKAWLDIAKITSGFIFRRVVRGGHVIDKAITDKSVALIIKKYAKKAGLTVKDFSGHSLRSGFITSGAAAGANLFKLMEISRHKKAETLMEYIRESKLFEDHAGEKFL